MNPQGTGSAEMEEVGRQAAERYRTVDVARILGVTPARVRRMVHAGHCAPGREGRAYRFAFQDLVLLRTAQGLMRKDISPRRVHRALRELKKQLPDSRPMSGVKIYAEGGHVVVRDRDRVWQPESGQQIFHFAVDDLARASEKVVAATARAKRVAGESAREWFDYGVSVEQDDPNGARQAYQRALKIDPDFVDAYTNLGRLVHDAGDAKGATKFYAEVLRRNADDALAQYNMAVACEDLDDLASAREHYEKAVGIDPELADAHFNLGRILEHLGRREEALKHLLAYRRLSDA